MISRPFTPGKFKSRTTKDHGYADNSWRSPEAPEEPQELLIIMDGKDC
jgi:hypothetical protein